MTVFFFYKDICVPCWCNSHSSQKRASDFPGTGVQWLQTTMWVQGTEPGSSGSTPRAHNFRGTSPVSSLLVTVVSLRRKAELKGPRMCSGSVLEHSTREAAYVFCDAAHPCEAQHFNSGQPESRPVQTFPFIPSGPSLGMVPATTFGKNLFFSVNSLWKQPQTNLEVCAPIS